MTKLLFKLQIWLLTCSAGSSGLSENNSSANKYSILEVTIGTAIATATTTTTGQQQPLIILPLRHLGLGNRLRIMAGIHSVALHYGRRLLVLWLPSDECNSGFHTLFNEMHPTLTVHDVDPTSDIAVNFYRSINSAMLTYANEHGLSAATARLQDFFVDLTQLANLRHQDISLLLLWTLGVHTPIHTPCADYLFAKSNFYRGLKPSAAVMARMYTSSGPGEGQGRSSINGFPGTTTRVIGIHVRAYDNHHFDWAVVAPMNSSAPALRFDEASPLEAFVAVMQQISAVHPTTRFFVASNSHEAKRELQIRLGHEAIITVDTVNGPATSAHGDRSSETGMILAAAEFFLLSACAYVVHSRGSSFAREAGAVHMRPVIDLAVGDDRTVLAVLMQHTALPQCGMHEYIRALPAPHPSSHPDPHPDLHPDPPDPDTDRSLEQATEQTCVGGTCPPQPPPVECYLEAGDRRMCTVALTVCPCEGRYHQRDFGIPSLLCNVEGGTGHSDLSQCVTLLAESNGYSL